MTSTIAPVVQTAINDPHYIQIELYDPHYISDDVVNALSVGMEAPLGLLLSAIENAMTAPLDDPPRRHPHVLVSAPRGFGKSFLMRALEIKLRETSSRQVVPVVLPEENYEFRHPHHFLRRIREKLGGRAPERGRFKNLGEEKDACQNRDVARQLWNDELEACQLALDARLGEEFDRVETDQRLIVVTLENLDMHRKSIFRAGSVGEALLQELLSNPHSRMLVIASACRNERPAKLRELMADPVFIPLSPWSPTTCFAYFEKLSQHTRGRGLTEGEMARARAIYNFIGGTPRLAAAVSIQLLEAETVDAAVLLHKIATGLSAYYKDRLDHLSETARDVIMTALDLGGTFSQAEVEGWLGYKSGQIASAFRELQDEFLLLSYKLQLDPGLPKRFGPSASAAITFQIPDRVLVYWYRLRERDHRTAEPLLHFLVDVLAAAFSAEEMSRMAVSAAAVGYTESARRIAEMARLSEATGRSGTRYYVLYHVKMLRALADRLPSRQIGNARQAIQDLAANRLGIARLKANQCAPNTSFAAAIDALATALEATPEDGVDQLRCVVAKTGEPSERILLTMMLMGMVYTFRLPVDLYEALYAIMEETNEAQLQEDAVLTRLSALIYRDLETAQFERAVRAAKAAIRRARRSKAWGRETVLQKHLGYGLGQLGRTAEAIAAYRRATELAQLLDDPHDEMISCASLGNLLGEAGKLSEAIELMERCVQLAADMECFEYQSSYLAQRARFFTVLAEQASQDKDWDYALQQWKKAIALAEAHGARETEISCRLSQALIHRRRGHLDLAMCEAQLAFAGAPTADLRLDAQTTLINILYDLGQYEDAQAQIVLAMEQLAAKVELETIANFADQALWIAGQGKRYDLFCHLVAYLTPKLREWFAMKAAHAAGPATRMIDSIKHLLRNILAFFRQASGTDLEMAAEALDTVGKELGEWPAALTRHPELIDIINRIYAKTRDVERTKRSLECFSRLAADAESLATPFTGWPTELPFASRDLTSGEASKALVYFQTASWLVADAASALVGVRVAEALPFQPSVDLVELALKTKEEKIAVARALRWWKDGECATQLLDGTNVPIYDLNDKLQPDLTKPETVESYARFFFGVVLGKLGAFRLVSSPAEVPFSTPLSKEMAGQLGQQIKPMKFERDGDGWRIRASVIFEPAAQLSGLFEATLKVSPNGTMELADEELLVNNLSTQRQQCDHDGLYYARLPAPGALPRQGGTRIDRQANRKVAKTSNMENASNLARVALQAAADDVQARLSEAGHVARRLIEQDESGYEAAGVFVIAFAAYAGDQETITALAGLCHDLFADAPSSSPQTVLTAAADFVTYGYNPAVLGKVSPEVSAAVRIWFGKGDRTAVSPRMPGSRRRRRSRIQEDVE